MTQQMRALWLLSAFALLLLPRHARGDNSEGAFAIGGNVDARELTAMNEGVSSALHEVSWSLTAKAPTEKEVVDLLKCLKPDGVSVDAFVCIPASLTARGVRRALIISATTMSGTNGSHVVEISAKITDGTSFVAGNRRCDPCTDDTLKSTLISLTRGMVNELAVRLGRTLLSVGSNPEGAAVLLDSDRVGATPLVGAKTYPGPHDLRIEKPGFIAVHRTIQAVEGKTTEIAVDLRSTADGPPPMPSDNENKGWWYVPGGFVVGGGLAVVGGGVLIYEGQQDGPDDKRRYTRATPLGIIVGALGVCAAGYGVYELVKGPKASTPTIIASNGGAMVGWAGSF